MARILLLPRVLRRDFVFVFMYAWIAVVLAAAAISYAIVGEVPPPAWANALFRSLWWPSLLGVPFAILEPAWLTLLAWGIARFALWAWLKYG